MFAFASAFVFAYMLMHNADAIYQPDSIDRYKHFDEQINNKTLTRCFLRSVEIVLGEFVISFDWQVFVKTLERVLVTVRLGSIVLTQSNQIIYAREQRNFVCMH